MVLCYHTKNIWFYLLSTCIVLQILFVVLTMVKWFSEMLGKEINILGKTAQKNRVYSDKVQYLPFSIENKVKCNWTWAKATTKFFYLTFKLAPY